MKYAAEELLTLRQRLVFKNESAMCQAFWKQILHFHQLNKISGEFAIFRTGNEQAQGGKRGMIAQVMEQRMGTLKGVPDYHIPGIGWLEAKRYVWNEKNQRIDKTYLSKDQRRFQAEALMRDEEYGTFRTPDEGIAILMEWGIISNVKFC